MNEQKKHKTHATLRQTVCGIEYDSVKNLTEFINKQLVGHWRRVTCKNCHKKRAHYEKRQNRKLWNQD